MKKYLDVLMACRLFYDITEHDLEKMLICLNAVEKRYNRDSVIILADDKISSIGVVLSGTVQVVREDYMGNRNILTELSASEIFAETFACAGIKKSPVTVLGVTECNILFVDYSRITTHCQSSCSFHAKLMENMLRLIAEKNLILSQKIEFLSGRTTREKLLAYLTAQSTRLNSRSFTIPFSRQELADFLCVDRSAMSRELGKLRDEGVIWFKGNGFEML